MYTHDIYMDHPSCSKLMERRASNMLTQFYMGLSNKRRLRRKGLRMAQDQNTVKAMGPSKQDRC